MIPKHPAPIDKIVNAQRRVLVERVSVGRQRDLIVEMKAHGGDTQRAENLLAAYELSLRIFEDDLKRLTRVRG
jgi:hypothetical protein